MTIIFITLQFQDMIDELNRGHPLLVTFIRSLPERLNYEMNWYKEHHVNFHEWFELNYENNYDRLPDNFLPNHYEIHIKDISLIDAVFNGSVGISVTVMNPNRLLILHADKLNIKKITAYEVQESSYERPHSIPVSRYKLSSEQQILKIFFERELKKNEKIRIIVEYSGILRDDMRGFYRSLDQHR